MTAYLRYAVFSMFTKVFSEVDVEYCICAMCTTYFSLIKSTGTNFALKSAQSMDKNAG